MTVEADWPRTTADCTQVVDPEVIENWQRGPRWFQVVALMLESAEVEARRRAVIERMADWLVPSAPGQAHVTLLPLGFGRTASPSGPVDDERPDSPVLSGSSWSEWFAAARAGFPIDIEVKVGGADSYRSAAFLQVTVPLAAGLRERLAIRLAHGGGPVGVDAPDVGTGGGGFHPHVTVGTYRQVVPVRDVAARIRDMRELPPLGVVGRLRLVAVDSRDRFGGLREV